MSTSDVASGQFKPLLNESVGYGVVIGVGFFFAALMLLLTTLQRKFSDFSPSSSEEFSSASRSVKIELIGCSVWYGVGGTIQLAFFAMVAAKIAKARFGTSVHVLFTFYGFVCILVHRCLLLLLIGIAVYVVFGGLHATFMCDWAHTIILFIIISLFAGHVYGTSPETGGVGALYDLLVQAGIDAPVIDNQDGSYLTMKSSQDMVFRAAAMLSGFAGVFCDQGYWQWAIAIAPQSTIKAYVNGIFFAISSCELTLMSHDRATDVGRAVMPKFPTYPHRLSASQVSAGLAAPAATVVVMGEGGAIAIQLVVSSKLKGVSMALNAASIDLGWLFYVQCRGVVLNSAVIPIALDERYILHYLGAENWNYGHCAWRSIIISQEVTMSVFVLVNKGLCAGETERAASKEGSKFKRS
ncbi:uncharacterized protein LAESUDRAFT_715131 [Laetiporus sulphureus 93-53]|uniref:Uncharacterized protein n=1 Tax=Laetiporus sulphureus 93-53 TaxID=1314785 RepID=A0A165DKJ9_9APHY|nr:uncharacterized protein LAESUDRAFT_715131 [Laetiporus sulphureus 93-53]KZT05086.1 hypothetical protein LAESUDRAFT_715131 [Laetiporus sulphureus 93-53]